MRNSMRVLAAATLISGGGAAVSAEAAEVSLVSGFFRTEESEQGGKDAGKKTTIDAGGRYSDQLDSHMFWFGQTMLTLKSYDKGDVGSAPSDSTSLTLGGGVRYYFAKLAENISPFVYGMGSYKSEQDGDSTANGSEETETNGLFYGGAFGIRLSLGPEFFVDMETPLFESALFATKKTTHETETSDPTAPGTTTVTKTEDETKQTELYVNTTGAFASVTIALGMRL